MNAVIVARVSTEDQKEAGNSLPAQVTRLERYCNSKGFKVIKVCSFDESAYTDDRTEFDRIIDFILEQKEKIAVCFDKVDRLSRNIFDPRIKLLYEKAINDEIELHFVSDGQVINSRISATEKFQFSISLDLAKYYSDAISDNVKRSQEQKIRKGEWLSKAPTGYRNIRKPDGSSDIIIDSEIAPIVKITFELYSTGAYSLLALSRKLKKEYGIDWPKGYLGKMLSNPFYHGTMLIKGHAYPHRYLTLISKELFDDVQRVKDSFNKKPRKIVGVPKYIYRGVLRCATCGLSITPEQHKGFVYYHCTQYNGKHDAAWLREEEITAQLGEAFKSFQMPDDIIDIIIKTLKEVHESKVDFHTKQFDALTREHKDITIMIDNLYRDKLKCKITDERYEQFYQELRSQLDNVTARLARLQGAEDGYYLNALYILELARRAYDLFVSSEVDEKRQLINLVLQNVRLDGKNLVWDVQKPFNLLLENGDEQRWRPYVDEFRNGTMAFDVGIQRAQTAFTTFGIPFISLA